MAMSILDWFTSPDYVFTDYYRPVPMTTYTSTTTVSRPNVTYNCSRLANNMRWKQKRKLNVRNK